MAQNNLTQGSISKNIVMFSLPYLLSYFLQTLYGMADLYFIGQYHSAATITAVSVGSQVMHMLTVIIVGLAMGTTVLISQAVGAGDKEKAEKTIGSSVCLFAIVAVVLTGVLLLCNGAIIRVMATPEESVVETRRYLMICFAGIPFIVAYNVISSVFRGMGDSKSPMYFIGIACVVNIVLDYLLIGVLKIGAAGAALGTVLAQTASVVIALVTIIRKKMIAFHKTSLRLNGALTGNIAKIGAPIAVQDGFVQISFLMITMIANRRGVDIAAAVGIVEKIIGIFFLVPSTMSSAVSAIAAQNNGAGLHERAKKTLGMGILVCVVVGLIFSVACQFIAVPFVRFFSKESEVVITYGAQYLRTYVADCIFAGIHFCFSGFFAAYNYSVISFIHNVISILAVRIPGAYLASKWYPEHLGPMGLAAPFGSLLSTIICCVMFFWLCRYKIPKQKEHLA